MTDQQHPITPPPELVHQWRKAPEYITELKKLSMINITTDRLQEIATWAARWGSDQELEACCEWLKTKEWIHPEFSDELHAARRPKPLTLAEQAYDALDIYIYGNPDHNDKERTYNTIRRALERLQELENND